jgi:hypothetical protein
MVPASSARSKKLISQDANNNTYNYKYTWSTEILPFSKVKLAACCCIPILLRCSILFSPG